MVELTGCERRAGSERFAVRGALNDFDFNSQVPWTLRLQSHLICSGSADPHLSHIVSCVFASLSSKKKNPSQEFSLGIKKVLFLERFGIAYVQQACS